MNPVCHTGRQAALAVPAIFATGSNSSSTVYSRRVSGPDRRRLDATRSSADHRRAADNRPSAGNQEYAVTVTTSAPRPLPATRNPALAAPLATDPGWR